MKPPLALMSELDVVVDRGLGGRASQNWQVRRGEQRLVLRRYLDVFQLGRDAELDSIRWRARARGVAGSAGWPTAGAVGAPRWHEGSWWELEEWLPGAPAAMSPQTHARLIADWHELGDVGAQVGPQPHRLDHLAVLEDPDAALDLRSCDDAEDRRWLLRRLEQARAGLEGVDLESSARVLVHGDLASQNVLWTGGTLTGVLDFELATVDRRITEAIHTWRCRYDDVLLAWHRIRPFDRHEWRMLLVDWWSLMVTLALADLRAGREPGRWQLDGLRRSSPLASHLEDGGAAPP